MTVEIRRASPEQWDAILAINEQSEPGVSPFDAQKLARLSSAADPFLVAVEADRVVAYLIAFGPEAAYGGACYLWFRERHPRSLYIDQVAVGSKWRRSGAATALYDALSATATDRGLQELTCEVNIDPPNPESMRFHQERGFGEVAQLTVPDGRVVSLQVRPLTPSALDSPSPGRH